MNSTLTPPTYQPPRNSNRGFILLACTGMLLTAAAGFVLGRFTGDDSSNAKTAATTIVTAAPGNTAGGASTTVAGASAELDAALALHAAGKLPEAKAAYEAILKTDPKNKYAFFNLGQIAQTNKDYDEAISKYKEALAVDPAYHPALFNEALAFESKNDLAGAIDLMRKADAAKPQDARTLFNLGRLLNLSGKTDEGNKLLAQAVSLDPSLAGAITGTSAPAASSTSAP